MELSWTLIGIVGFICQFDWGMECPDIWLNIIVGISMRVCMIGLIQTNLYEIDMGISRLSKADFSSQSGWASSNHLKTWIEQKGWERGNSFCLTVWGGTLVFSSLWTWTETLALLGSRACQLSNWNLSHMLSCFSGLWILSGTTLSLPWVSVLLIANLGNFF